MQNSGRTSKCSAFLLPGRALFIAALLYLLLGCAAFFSQPAFLVWFLAGTAFVPFIIADAVILALLGDRLHVKRSMPFSLAQGEPVRVTLEIRRGSHLLLPFSILISELYPDSMRVADNSEESTVFPARLDRTLLKKSEAVIFEYTLVPVERGPWFFSGLQLLSGSPLHFWRLRVTHRVTSRGRTYPDFKKIAQGTALKGLPEKGQERQIRKRGQGLEFESLRDFQKGDSIRLIDWRATSRNRQLDGRLKLIVRNYQEEQDQQVLFIIDSGYRLPDFQFDSALNATLLLAYIALKHGDGVGAASFGAQERWIAPRKGISSFTALMNGLYDLHSAPVPSSPFSALETALARLHRRSFIVLISNFREEDGESLSWILPRIEKRHLLLLVSFRESEAEVLAAGQNTTVPELPAKLPAELPEQLPAAAILETAAAFSYLANRRRLYRKWEHSGLLVLETSAEHISSALINQYLAVKRSGKL
jgi:uncharacterized protein (DUF58 family)